VLAWCPDRGSPQRRLYTWRHAPACSPPLALIPSLFPLKSDATRNEQRLCVAGSPSFCGCPSVCGSGVITPFFVNNSDSYAPVQAPRTQSPGAMPPPSPRLRISTDYDDPKVWTGRSLSFVARCPRPLPLAIVYNPTLVSRPGLVHLHPSHAAPWPPVASIRVATPLFHLSSSFGSVRMAASDPRIL